jgi:hypothetical protein
MRLLAFPSPNPRLPDASKQSLIEQDADALVIKQHEFQKMLLSNTACMRIAGTGVDLPAGNGQTGPAKEPEPRGSAAIAG